MKLGLIEAAGFRGIKSSVSVPVTDGFLILNGRNGSGKSTLFDAIEFALTGQISRPALTPENREGIDNYIWWRGSGEPLERVVRLVFDLGDHRNLEVTRRPEGAEFRVFNHSGEISVLDEAALRGIFARESAPETQLLPRLCGTTIIRDEQITELSVDAPEASRFTLVRDTLGSTQTSDIEERLKRTKQVLDARVKRLESAYESARVEVNRLVAQTSEARSDFETEPDSEQAQLGLAVALGLARDSDNDELMRRARSRIGQLRSHTSTLSRSIPRLKEIERRRTEIETEAYQATDRRLNQQLVQGVEAERLAKDARSAAEREAGRFEEQQPHIRSLGELLEHGKRVGLQDGRCPLCGSGMTEESFESHLRETAETVERESRGLSTALTSREEALRAEGAAESRRRQAEAALRKHSQLGDDLRVELEEVDREIRKMEGFAAPRELGADAIESSLAEARSGLAAIEAPMVGLEVSAAYARLVEQERVLAQAREGLASVQKSLDAARRASSHREQADRTVRRVAGELVDERLAQLEPLLMELYERLRPHVEWATVGYRVRGDVRRFMRLTVGDDELNPRFMFSSGQRRALGLAFLLSIHLSTTWSRWNTLIMDDPMQHVDDYRALHLAEVLGSIRRSGKQRNGSATLWPRTCWQELRRCETVLLNQSDWQYRSAMLIGSSRATSSSNTSLTASQGYQAQVQALNREPPERLVAFIGRVVSALRGNRIWKMGLCTCPGVSSMLDLRLELPRPGG